MSEVLASNVLANGLLQNFRDTYLATLERASSSNLSKVMDLSIPAINRQHEFAYFNAAPHMEYWRRGDTIPVGSFDSVTFTVLVHEFAKRVPWFKFDRKDDQTQSLFDMARATGTSAGLIPERGFFDLLLGQTNLIPGTVNAPDGVSMYNAQDGNGNNRFGVSGGNRIASGGGVASPSAVMTDFYLAVARAMQFQDGQGQPLFSPEVANGGITVIFGSHNLKVFEEAFLQRRQGIETATNNVGTTPTNIVQDASRNVTLWPTQRIASGNDDWYIFFDNAPKKPTFVLDREGLQEFTSLEGDNNSDHTRSTAQEYVQWEIRQGFGIALPYGTIEVNN